MYPSHISKKSPSLSFLNNLLLFANEMHYMQSILNHVDHDMTMTIVYKYSGFYPSLLIVHRKQPKA